MVSDIKCYSHDNQQCLLLPWCDALVVKGEVSLCEDAETLTLTFPDPLPLGEASLYITYKGMLNDKMKGFYRSKYTTPSGEERYGAVTQFEVCCVCLCSVCLTLNNEQCL